METLKNFYEKLAYPIPQNLDNSFGHFNVFRRTNCSSDISYSRKDYFKITLLKGPNRIHYANKTLETKEYALMFSDPLIPYSWDSLNGKKEGYFCIFTGAFFHQQKNIRTYPMFQMNQEKLFILDMKTFKIAEEIFKKMMQEIRSDYTFKYDLLRNLTEELIHLALKMNPAPLAKKIKTDQQSRITELFFELLNRQFPIQMPYERLELKRASDYAKLLGIHTNHLNRILKHTTGKTTTQLIAQRVLEEAKFLLKHSNWHINELSFSLGYEEPAHFINFFKKNLDFTPKSYKTLENV